MNYAMSKRGAKFPHRLTMGMDEIPVSLLPPLKNTEVSHDSSNFMIHPYKCVY